MQWHDNKATTGPVKAFTLDESLVVIDIYIGLIFSHVSRWIGVMPNDLDLIFYTDAFSVLPCLHICYLTVIITYFAQRQSRKIRTPLCV